MSIMDKSIIYSARVELTMEKPAFNHFAKSRITASPIY